MIHSVARISGTEVREWKDLLNAQQAAADVERAMDQKVAAFQYNLMSRHIPQFDVLKRDYSFNLTILDDGNVVIEKHSRGYNE